MSDGEFVDALVCLQCKGLSISHKVCIKCKIARQPTKIRAAGKDLIKRIDGINESIAEYNRVVGDTHRVINENK